MGASNKNLSIGSYDKNKRYTEEKQQLSGYFAIVSIKRNLNDTMSALNSKNGGGTSKQQNERKKKMSEQNSTPRKQKRPDGSASAEKIWDGVGKTS